VHGEGLRVGEWLDCDVEFGVWAEVAASVSQIWTSKKCGICERLFVAFKAVTGKCQWLLSSSTRTCTHTFIATGRCSCDELAKVNGSISA
jgi:hypothetical protein